MSDPLHEGQTPAGTHGAAGGQIAPPDPPLTGIWQANDGGMYFLQQIADTLWWVGLSQTGAFYPGLHFCNVYYATVRGNVVTGEWSDVPRGAADNRGTMTLRVIDGNPQVLRRDAATGGGFGGSRWWRVASSPWPFVSARDLFPVTFKDAQKTEILWIGGGLETLADNLELIRDSASVFGTVKTGQSHPHQAVAVNYPAKQGRTYRDFITLNDSSFPGFGGILDELDGDVTFSFVIDRDQLRQQKPDFFAGVAQHAQAEAGRKMLASIEGEIIMYGRSADEDEDAETPPLFPGWAEPTGSSVLFNGMPFPPVFPSTASGSSERTFLNDLTFEDRVRVTGPMIFDIGHPERWLEIHPVYSVDKITATFSNDLSGAWADDVGNTYYLRHHLDDNTVWFAGLTPLGRIPFGQVFVGTFHPAPKVLGDPAVPEGIGVSPPVLPQDALTGNAVAISLGYGTCAPFETSGTRLGDTGVMTFALGSTNLVGMNVPTLSTGEFRLMKLYDA